MTDTKEFFHIFSIRLFIRPNAAQIRILGKNMNIKKSKSCSIGSEEAQTCLWVSLVIVPWQANQYGMVKKSTPPGQNLWSEKLTPSKWDDHPTETIERKKIIIWILIAFITATAVALSFSKRIFNLANLVTRNSIMFSVVQVSGNYLKLKFPFIHIASRYNNLLFKILFLH